MELLEPSPDSQQPFSSDADAIDVSWFDADIPPTPAPFVWQHERRLLLLDEEPIGWVLAELEFDPETCRYTEVRRAVYEWEREGIGALLSRALASGDVAVRDAAEALNGWLVEHYDHTIHESRTRPNWMVAHNLFN